jgi:hypothetical protein
LTAVRTVLLAAVLLAACQSEDVSRRIGARCDVTADCDQKCLVPGSDWPGGFCTVACTSDGDCGGGDRCIDEDGGVCVFGCTSTPDCGFLGSAYVCTEVDAQGAKVMACRGG